MNSNIIIALSSSLIGFLIGYFVRGFVDKRGNTDNREIVLISITLVWVLSMIVSFINATYQTSPLVHGLMGGIVGYLFKKPDNPNEKDF